MFRGRFLDIFWELWIQQGLGCRKCEKESEACEPRIPTCVSQTPVRSYMFHMWVESLFAHREYTARAEMLCCGGTHDQRLWLHTSAEGTSGHLREKQETPLTPWRMLTLCSGGRPQTHTSAVMLVTTRVLERRGYRVGIGVDIGSQSEWTDSLGEFEFYPKKHVKWGLFTRSFYYLNVKSLYQNTVHNKIESIDMFNEK